MSKQQKIGAIGMTVYIAGSLLLAVSGYMQSKVPAEKQEIVCKIKTDGRA